MAVAEAPKPKVTRNRTASPFTPQTRVTISVHKDATNADATTTAIGGVLEEFYTSDGLVVRLVSRTRKTVKKAKTAGTHSPANLMVYVAPAGYKFATAVERGVRLDADTANLLRSVAERMGLDPNDPASITAVAKALAQKASGN